MRVFFIIEIQQHVRWWASDSEAWCQETVSQDLGAVPSTRIGEELSQVLGLWQGSSMETQKTFQGGSSGLAGHQHDQQGMSSEEFSMEQLFRQQLPIKRQHLDFPSDSGLSDQCCTSRKCRNPAQVLVLFAIGYHQCLGDIVQRKLGHLIQ